MNIALELERLALRPVTEADRQRVHRSPAARALQADGVDLQTATHATTGDTPEWLRLSMCDAAAGLINNTALTCAHRGVLPPVHAAAWKPGVVVCPACTGLLALADGDPSELRCDACGHMCAGPPAEPIYLGTIAWGPLIFQYGVCGDCALHAPGGSP